MFKEANYAHVHGSMQANKKYAKPNCQILLTYVSWQTFAENLQIIKG